MSQRRARQARRANGPDKSPQPGRSRLFRDRRLWSVAGVLALVAVIGAGIVVARGSGAAEPIVQRSSETVSFSGTDPVTGKRVSLADYTGKPVVINVWGSWCPGCAAEAEDLRRFAADHPEAQLIGIDLQDSKGSARAFYEQYGWRHPSISDPDGEISFSLGLQGTPSTFFLDAQHRVRTRIVGETDYAGFERGLEAALGSS
ncbi:MAG TPA: TlpA disulfide reductase family protein [Gaiellaceae bacterium]|nr:TlpA disulfide reductase family protein [Gaiellaceae bacterium]